MEPFDDEARRRGLNYEKATVPFYISLGRFLHNYAMLESIMLRALIKASGVSHEVGQSIYSGTRVSAAKDFINRILDAQNNQALKARLKPYFDQIGLINSMRDDILHYGATCDFTTGVLTVSNTQIAHIPNKLREYEVSPTLLDNMTDDVGRAISGLMLEFNIVQGDPDVEALLQAQIASPWRYTQPQPTPPRSEPK